MENRVPVDGDALVGMKEICAVMRRSEDTVLALHRGFGFPMAREGGVWISTRAAIAEWRKGRVEGVLQSRPAPAEHHVLALETRIAALEGEVERLAAERATPQAKRGRPKKR